MKVFLFRYVIDPAKIRHRMVISTPTVKLLLSATKYTALTSVKGRPSEKCCVHGAGHCCLAWVSDCKAEEVNKL